MIDIRYFEHRSSEERAFVRKFLNEIMGSNGYHGTQSAITALCVLLGEYDSQLERYGSYREGHQLEVAARIRRKEMEKT